MSSADGSLIALMLLRDYPVSQSTPYSVNLSYLDKKFRHTAELTSVVAVRLYTPQVTCQTIDTDKTSWDALSLPSQQPNLSILDVLVPFKQPLRSSGWQSLS